jgi:hypothetical protein
MNRQQLIGTLVIALVGGVALFIHFVHTTSTPRVLIPPTRSELSIRRLPTPAAPTATIDKRSLVSETVNPTITGIASGVPFIAVVISSNQPSDPWGTTFGDWFAFANVNNGRWSLQVAGLSQTTLSVIPKTWQLYN